MTLPDGWKQGRLGELCSIEIGGTPPRGVAAYWDSTLDTSNIWVSIRDMRQRTITGSAEQISDLGVKKSNVKLQQPATVLLSFKLSIGRVAFAAVPLFTNEAIAGLCPTGLTRDSLFHGLQDWDLLQGVDQAIKGATLNKQKLKQILFDYPESEHEQSKIAEVLSTVDRAIEQTEALIAKQQRIKTGLMQALLTRGIDEHGHLRSEQTHKFKDSPLGRIPDGIGVCAMSGVNDWSRWKLEDCCDILDSKRIPVNAKERHKRIGDIPYYGANGQQGFIDDFIFDEPLILIAEDGGQFDEFATRSIAYRVCGKSWVNNHAHVLRAKSGFCQDAVFYTLEHKDIQPFIVGGTRAKLNQRALRSIEISLPRDETEQIKIAEVLSTVDRVIEQTEALIAKWQRIKTGLMQDLLTGNRRVTPLLEQCERVMT